MIGEKISHYKITKNSAVAASPKSNWQTRENLMHLFKTGCKIRYLFFLFIFFYTNHCADQPIYTGNPLIGTWKFLSLGGTNSEGDTLLPYGEKPYGRLMYDAKGNVCVLLMRSGRPQFQSGDMAESTCEELRAAFMGFDAYCGTYRIDTNQHTVTHRIEGARFPNWVGTEQTRNYIIRSDSLILAAPVKVGGGIWDLQAVLVSM